MAILTYGKITDLGIPATYWVVSSITIGKNPSDPNAEDIVIILLDGYMSKKVYETPNSKYLERKEFVIRENDKHYNMFTESAIKEAACNHKSIYDIAYEYIGLIDKNLINTELEDCKTCTITSCPNNLNKGE